MRVRVGRTTTPWIDMWRDQSGQRRFAVLWLGNRARSVRRAEKPLDLAPQGDCLFGIAETRVGRWTMRILAELLHHPLPPFTESRRIQKARFVQRVNQIRELSVNGGSG